MLILEFVKKMTYRFPSYLKTTDAISVFESECNEKLKAWQGATLGFVYHEFADTIRTRTHPVMPDIVDMCRKKELEQENKKITHKPTVDILKDRLGDEFKNSSHYGPCCVKLIARSVFTFIKKNQSVPNEFDLKQMEKVRDEFLSTCRGMRSGKIRDPFKVFQLSCGGYLQDIALLREHLMLNQLPNDYLRPTFEEHNNRDMDYPLNDQLLVAGVNG